MITDLSFPIGEAVNDGMIKDNYLGHHIKLSFPRVDNLALRIYNLGPTAMMFKVDLSKIFSPAPPGPRGLLPHSRL